MAKRDGFVKKVLIAVLLGIMRMELITKKRANTLEHAEMALSPRRSNRYGKFFSFGDAEQKLLSMTKALCPKVLFLCIYLL